MKRPLIGALSVLSFSSFAAIPQNQRPSQGSTDNILQLILYYAYDIALYGGSILIAFLFIYYLTHLWDLYSETKEKRATKKDLLTDAIIGAVMLLFSIWGLNYGLDILKGV